MKKIIALISLTVLMLTLMVGCGKTEISDDHNEPTPSITGNEKIKLICDLAPTESNNRNSEGAFIDLADERILFAYSRYGSGGFDDGAPADIYAVISQDGGESFGEPFALWTRQQAQADNVMSVSFLRMENGDIGLFYLAKRGLDQCLLYLVRSADEGKTFGQPLLISGEQGYYVGNNDRVIRTKDGRLLFPTALHEAILATDKAGSPYLKSLQAGQLIVYASEDDGQSWAALNEPLSIPLSGGCRSGVQEPGLVEMSDGQLWCWMRTDTGRQYEAYSQDGGYTWSEPLPSRFTSPASPLSMKRLPTGQILTVWNPVPLYNGQSVYTDGVWLAGRSPLVYAISRDGGVNFSDPIAIETDESRGYCYTAIHATRDGILLAYCAGGVEDGDCRNRLRIVKIYPF